MLCRLPRSTLFPYTTLFRSAEYRKYPKYLPNGKEILFGKADNFYTYNTFWNVVKNQSAPIFIEGCTIIDKDLNQSNMDYTNRADRKSTRLNSSHSQISYAVF